MDTSFSTAKTFFLSNGVTIDGGPDKNTITFEPDSTGDRDAPLFDVRGADVTVQNIKLEADGTPGNDALINLNSTDGFNANSFTADNVDFSDAFRGIGSSGAIPVNLTVTDSDFSNLIRGGIDLNRDLLRAGSEFAPEPLGTDGLSQVSAGNLNISNNTFSGLSQVGIQIDSGNDGFEPDVGAGGVPGFDNNTQAASRTIRASPSCLSRIMVTKPILPKRPRTCP